MFYKTAIIIWTHLIIIFPGCFEAVNVKHVCAHCGMMRSIHSEDAIYFHCIAFRPSTAVPAYRHLVVALLRVPMHSFVVFAVHDAPEDNSAYSMASGRDKKPSLSIHLIYMPNKMYTQQCGGGH